VSVAGRVLLRDGRLVDEDRALASRVQASADALHRWAAENPHAAAKPPAAATR